MPSNPNRVAQFLEGAVEVFWERNIQYGNNYEYFGEMLKVLFPKGMKLETASDFARASNLFNIISKLSRYAKNFDKGGHEDSAIDSAVYWAIQQELDNVENGEYADAAAEEARGCTCGNEDERKGEDRRIRIIKIRFECNRKKTAGDRRIRDFGRACRGEIHYCTVIENGKAIQIKRNCDRSGKERRQGSPT